MDAAILSERLRGKEDDIVNVMTHLGFKADNIRSHKGGAYLTTTALHKDADNKNGVIVYTDSLVVMQPTHGRQYGNIFTLTMDTMHCSFPQALKYISFWTGYKEDIKVHLPFGGFYKTIGNGDSDVPTFHIYSENDLPAPNNLSQKYFLDGVSFKTQQLFGVRMDFKNDAIITPIRGYDGTTLIGAKSRSNDDNCPHDRRFYAPLPYPKNQVVYGYAINYAEIVKHNTLLLFESEKSTMQAYSFGLPVGLAIGGHSISKMQARYIKSLGAKNIIVAFDSDVLPEEKEFESKKLLQDEFGHKNNVYFIDDAQEQFIRRVDKVSPSDYGRRVLEKLVKQCKIQVR